MDFKTAAKFGSLIAKEYALDFFELLVKYQDFSASEAASRLGLHIRTAQDFLETLAELEIVQKEEAQDEEEIFKFLSPVGEVHNPRNATIWLNMKTALQTLTKLNQEIVKVVRLLPKSSFLKKGENFRVPHSMLQALSCPL